MVEVPETWPQSFLHGGGKRGKASWYPVAALPPLGFDHARIIADALARLTSSSS